MTKYLYRIWRRAVTLSSASANCGRTGAWLLVLIPALLLPVAAQWRAPRPERTSARAIGVLELFPNGARRLVPVALFYERRYYDAGLYRAAPVPFTISPQTVYEVQRSGKPLGTFTVWKASTGPEGFWVGAGVFRTAPDPATLAKERKPPAPVVLGDPTRPVLHRREGSEGDRPVAKKSSAPAAADDPERPRLQRRSQAADSSTGQSEPPQDSGADRPVLRRGKPAQGVPSEPEVGLLGQKEQSGGDLTSQEAGTVAKNQEGVRPSTPTAGALGTPQRQVAVSDAAPSEPQELLFPVHEPQRPQLESAARQLARSELLRLAPMRGLSIPGATAKATTSGQHAPQPSTSTAGAPGTLEIAFEDEQFVPYDLDYKDYATVVFSGRYRPAASGAAASAGAAKDRGWIVTIIARQDGDKLAKLYSAVSDPRELDLYPEVRLVDAVDPEGYGRFALLFREQKRDGVSWLIGRVSGYELQTIFETAAR